MKKIAILATLVFVLLAGLTLAQDEEWTCDNGPNDVLNAAQAAYEAEDMETAWWLAARAEALCVDNPERFEMAYDLRYNDVQRRGRYDLFKDAGRDDAFRYNIGDYSLFMYCLGEGSPTVIFESGMSSGASQWNDILPSVSTVTRACTYSRWGARNSDPFPQGFHEGRTAQDHVNDLVALLEVTEIEPPYLLVGYCIGGQDVVVFTDQNPDLVDGLVLVEPDHPDMWDRWEEAGKDDFGFSPAPMLASPAFGEEKFNFRVSSEQAAAVETLGDLPLAVIVAPEGFTGTDPIWIELMEDYASYSTNSRYIDAETGDHWSIVRDSPNTVIEAILWVLDEVWAAEEEVEE
jgi:pimeloyl-ACP methyl ester carboxylesterase